ncbi:MAG: iron-sulfur cluster assembly scaffold protein [Fimbriimonadales bacterium]
MYSQTANDHVASARNVGKPEGCTHSGVVGAPGDGPFLAIHLTVVGGIVRAAGFNTWGCPAAIACGSCLSEMLEGRSLEEARRISPKEIIATLGGLPESKEGRAEMAVEALQKALPEVT